MLEYLKRHDALFPFYPMVEVLALREEKERLSEISSFYRDALHYTSHEEEYAEELGTVFIEQEPVVQLQLLDDASLASSLDLTDVVVHGSPAVSEKIFRERWNKLNHYGLKQLITHDDKVAWCESYFQWHLHYYQERRQAKRLRQTFLAWRSHMHLIRKPPRYAQSQRLIYDKWVYGVSRLARRGLDPSVLPHPSVQGHSEV
jgi:hypothetical protein